MSGISRFAPSNLFVVLFLCCLAIGLSSRPTAASAETYIGGQFGAVFPRDITSENIDNACCPPSKGAGIDYKTSAAYGIKIGHYFNGLRFLGVELDYLHANPHLAQKGSFAGEYFRVDSYTINVVLRYPGEKFQPYFAVGPSLMYATASDSTLTRESQRDRKVGINAELGTRYMLRKNVALFGEMRMQYARFHYPETTSFNSYQASYAAPSVLFGIAFNVEPLFKD